MEASLALGGQVVGRIDSVLPVREVIDSTMTEFRDCARRFAAFT
jgi:hypothetical protein